MDMARILTRGEGIQGGRCLEAHSPRPHGFVSGTHQIIVIIRLVWKQKLSSEHAIMKIERSEFLPENVTPRCSATGRAGGNIDGPLVIGATIGFVMGV